MGLLCCCCNAQKKEEKRRKKKKERHDLCHFSFIPRVHSSATMAALPVLQPDTSETYVDLMACDHSRAFQDFKAAHLQTGSAIQELHASNLKNKATFQRALFVTIVADFEAFVHARFQAASEAYVKTKLIDDLDPEDAHLWNGFVAETLKRMTPDVKGKIQSTSALAFLKSIAKDLGENAKPLNDRFQGEAKAYFQSKARGMLPIWETRQSNGHGMKSMLRKLFRDEKDFSQALEGTPLWLPVDNRSGMKGDKVLLTQAHCEAMLKLVYGTRCVLAHGSAERTFEDGGAFHGLKELFTEAIAPRLTPGETYFRYKLEDITENGREVMLHSDFVLFAMRFLLGVGAKLDLLLNKVA